MSATDLLTLDTVAARLSVYDLRGSRATAWLDAGASLPQVGYLLGHAAATTAARYVRGTAESAARVVRGETGVSGGDSGERGQTYSGAKGGA
jgi:site-specific recombinase XerD